MKKRKQDDRSKYKLTPKQLDLMMPPGDKVHTFMQGGCTLIGADRARSSILKDAKRRCEISGKFATAMHHGAVVWDKDNVEVFVETRRNGE